MIFIITATRRPLSVTAIGPESFNFQIEATSRTAATRLAKAECRRQGWRFQDAWTLEEWGEPQATSPLKLTSEQLEGLL